MSDTWNVSWDSASTVTTDDPTAADQCLGNLRSHPSRDLPQLRSHLPPGQHLFDGKQWDQDSRSGYGYWLPLQVTTSSRDDHCTLFIWWSGSVQHDPLLPLEIAFQFFWSSDQTSRSLAVHFFIGLPSLALRPKTSPMISLSSSDAACWGSLASRSRQRIASPPLTWYSSGLTWLYVLNSLQCLAAEQGIDVGPTSSFTQLVHSYYHLVYSPLLPPPVLPGIFIVAAKVANWATRSFRCHGRQRSPRGHVSPTFAWRSQGSMAGACPIGKLRYQSSQ